MISAALICSPSRNRWAISSSRSATASSSFSRWISASASRSAGIGPVERVAEFVAPGERLHVDEVDHAPEVSSLPDRDLERHRVGAQAVPDHVHVAPEVGAGAVELVDEAETRHPVAIRLSPDRLGLRLDAGHAVEDHDRAVEHAQAALDLDREVHVSGRVDNVDAVVGPEAGRGSGGDGDPPLLLLLHPVHGGGALVDLADLVDLLRVEQDPLGHGRLARVDVGDDPDVAGVQSGDGRATVAS